MVGTASILAMVVTLFISTVLPILVYIVYGVKNKGKGVWTAWLIGAAGFTIMQLVIRTPILSLLSLSAGFVTFAKEHYTMYVLVLAFTAALFELVARYVIAKILQKKQFFEKAVAVGLGHGGIEAIALIGLAYVNNILYSLMINTGVYDTLVSQTASMGVDTTSLLVAKASLIETSPTMFLLAGYERILTMILHVAMTVLVFYFVKKKKDIVGIILCLLIHTLIDFVPAFLVGIMAANLAYIITYTFLTVMAVLGIIILVVIKKKWSKIQ